MAAQIPASLKAADLTRFFVRAAQLESVKPVVAYWCEYWIANQILAKELHNEDEETLQYTMGLMDKLETIKAENATNDAILDDVAGQAYIEQFASETFQRAERAVQANKVTKQTADTFQAAATFFELVNIWGPPEAETLAKIKYAKWNALRIVRAIKEGKDPNDSNPKKEPEAEILPELDPNDPEVKNIGLTINDKQPSVEEVPDEQDQIQARLAHQSLVDQSLHPSAQASTQASAQPTPSEKPGFEPYPRDGFPYNAVKNDNVSPLEPSPNERNGSVGGGYFPEVPTFTSESQQASFSTAPAEDTLDLGLPSQPSTLPGSQNNPDIASNPTPSTNEAVSPPPQNFYQQAPPPQQPAPISQPPPSIPKFVPAPAPVQPQQTTSIWGPSPSAGSKVQYNTDDVAIAKAQKHARWAISALNFEDVDTAVRELRGALETLGAQ